LRQIPFGETKSYTEIARTIGSPRASRAVGAANGKNPLSIVVPCHRVIGASGALTGFGGGIETKAQLLALEAGAGVRLLRLDYPC
jgi:methylated-DNA-[protein]-cysteine S-methyltransferase